MSAWITVRSYLISFVVPIAIRIIKEVLTALKPDMLEKFRVFLQATYDGAVAGGDTITQSICVIVGELFGIVVVLAPAGPGVLSPAEILTSKDTLFKNAVNNYIVEESPEIPPVVGN